MIRQFLVNESESDDDEPKGKRQKPAPARLVKPDCFLRFPWLVHDSEKRVFRCKVCTDAKAKNIFVSGKDCSKPKKDDLAKHETSADHRRSTTVKRQQREFVAATVTANDHAKAAVIAQMRTVLTQAKHCLPTAKNAALVELQILNVSTGMAKVHTIIPKKIRKDLRDFKKDTVPMMIRL